MKLPVLRPRQVEQILKRAGYTADRQTGSHRIFVHPRKIPHVAVPVTNKDIKPGTLRGIIKQAEMTPEEFLRWRK